MKAAVISLAPTYGKSTFISVLAGVYSRSQKRSVVVMTTGDANDNIQIVDTPVRNDEVANPYVFKSMVEAAELKDESLLNYGVRQGAENVFIFNILGSSMAQNEKEEFFFTAMDKLPATLTLVEICGDYHDEFNRKVIAACDCCLCLIDVSQKSIGMVAEFNRFLKELDAEDKDKLSDKAETVAYVLAKYDPNVMGEKKLTKQTGIAMAGLMKFYYIPALQRYALNGDLDKLAYDIITGINEVVQLRMALYEVMCYLFDAKGRKIIREIGKWYK